LISRSAIAYSTLYIELLVLGQDQGQNLVIVQAFARIALDDPLIRLQVIKGGDREGDLPKHKRLGCGLPGAG